VLATGAGVRCSRRVEHEGQIERSPPARALSAPLLLGMLIAPPLFVWLFLRPGYSASQRRAAFFYTAVMLAIALIGRFGA